MTSAAARHPQAGCVTPGDPLSGSPPRRESAMIRSSSSCGALGKGVIRPGEPASRPLVGSTPPVYCLSCRDRGSKRRHSTRVSWCSASDRDPVRLGRAAVHSLKVSLSGYVSQTRQNGKKGQTAMIAVLVTREVNHLHITRLHRSRCRLSCVTLTMLAMFGPPFGSRLWFGMRGWWWWWLNDHRDPDLGPFVGCKCWLRSRGPPPIACTSRYSQP